MIDLKTIFNDSFKNEDSSYKNEIVESDISLLFKHKILKSFLPEKKYNGLGYTIEQTLKLIEDASYLNGSLGWLVQIGNGGNYFLSNFSEEQAQHYFPQTNFVIAGSGTSTATATSENEGFIVSGKWKYCSGSIYASHFTITFNTEKEEVYSAIIPRKDVSIIFDWDTIGMKNTSTNSIQISDIFIHKNQLFKVNVQKQFQDTSPFNLPFLIYAQGFFIHVLYGMVNRMIVESKTSISKDIFIQFKKEHSKILNYCSKNQNLSYKEEESFQETYRLQAIQLKAIASDIFTSRGMQSIFTNDLISVFYLDVLTICQHKLLQT